VGHPPHDLTKAGPYPLYGFGVIVTDYGTYKGESGLLPDLLNELTFMSQLTADALSQYKQQSQGLSPDEKAALVDSLFGAVQTETQRLNDLEDQFLQAVFDRSSTLNNP
jgi:hypothetical protein